MPDERFEPCVNGFFAIFNTKLFISYNDYNLQKFFLFIYGFKLR